MQDHLLEQVKKKVQYGQGADYEQTMELLEIIEGLQRENGQVKEESASWRRVLENETHKLKIAEEALENERKEALLWDGVGTVKRIDAALSLIRETKETP